MSAYKHSTILAATLQPLQGDSGENYTKKIAVPHHPIWGTAICAGFRTIRRSSYLYGIPMHFAKLMCSK
jgi:hypothetical protein